MEDGQSNVQKQRIFRPAHCSSTVSEIIWRRRGSDTMRRPTTVASVPQPAPSTATGKENTAQPHDIPTPCPPSEVNIPCAGPPSETAPQRSVSPTTIGEADKSTYSANEENRQQSSDGETSQTEEISVDLHFHRDPALSSQLAAEQTVRIGGEESEAVRLTCAACAASPTQQPPLEQTRATDEVVEPHNEEGTPYEEVTDTTDGSELIPVEASVARKSSSPIPIASTPSSIPSALSPYLLSSPTSPPLEEDHIPPAYIFGDSFTTATIPHTTPQTPASCELCDRNFHFDGSDMVVENETQSPLRQTASVSGSKIETSEEGVLEEVAEVRRVDRLKLAIAQLRNFKIATGETAEAQLSVAVRFDNNDNEELFAAVTVPASGSPNFVLSDATTFDFPTTFNHVVFVLQEITSGGRTATPVGRVSLKRSELVQHTQEEVNNSVDENTSEGAGSGADRWLPIERLHCTQSVEILGYMCLDLGWNNAEKELSMRVLDYVLYSCDQTSDSRACPQQEPASRPSSRQHQRSNDGRLYLRVCISTGSGLFSAMKKIKVLGRRSTESCRLDCSLLCRSPPPTDVEAAHPNITSPSVSNTAMEREKVALDRNPPPAPPPRRSKKPKNLKLNTSEASQPSTMNHDSTPPVPPPRSSRPPAAPPTPKEKVRLNIKVYNDASYDEQQAYCGYIRVPLDRTTMLPNDDLLLGPNWFSIKSRQALGGDIAPTQQLPPPPYIPLSTAGGSTRVKVPPPRPTQPPQQPGVRSLSLHHRHALNPTTTASALTAAPSSRSAMAAGTLKLPSAHHQKPHDPALQRQQPTNAMDRRSRQASAATPQPAPSLRPTPSLSSLKGLLQFGGSGPSSMPNTSTASKHGTLMCQSLSSDRLLTATSSAPSPMGTAGEMRVKWTYEQDELLPFSSYQPLHALLLDSFNVQPCTASLLSLLHHLPIDMESMVRPLMKIFVHAKSIRPFFGLICTRYVQSCNDVNTLFRSQSIAAKSLYETMKFLGHNYLTISLKPLIDLIYVERKSCEIDPSKIRPGESLEQNLRNISVYAELAFSRVVESHPRCPPLLKSVFAELRSVVQQRFPGRDEVARLAISSFLIMRFFAAAILNPKLFGLRHETPDANVARTLVLVSKILQRISNCVVSAQPLTTKEQWLVPVLTRFSDDTHRTAMINFLDCVSCDARLQHPHHSDGAEANDENVAPVAPQSPLLLKHGHMIERRSGADKKRSFKNLIHQKRRYVTLTESVLSWQKLASGSTTTVPPHLMGKVLPVEGEGDGPTGKQHQLNRLSSPAGLLAELKGELRLADVSCVSVLPDAKNSFRVATPTSEVHFQAQSVAEMNEWIVLIQRQQRRHLMMLNRTPPDLLRQGVPLIDLERELHAIHTQFAQHLELLHQWRLELEGGGDRGPANTSATTTLPLDELFPPDSEMASSDEQREYNAIRLHETLLALIAAIEHVLIGLEEARCRARTSDEAEERRDEKVARSHLAATSTMVDDANYLHLSSGYKRVRKQPFNAQSPPVPPPLQQR